MYVTAFFTSSGVPQTGLTPTIRIRDVITNTLIITDDTMSEVGDGWYKYSFASYDPDVDYVVRCDGGATLTGSERYAYAGTDSESGDMIAQAVQPYILADATPFNGADVGIIKTQTAQTQAIVSLLQKLETGRWKISGVQLIFYDTDSITPILKFNLFDAQGKPTGANVFEMVPVPI